MKREIAKKWVAALRSGEYRQVQGRLRIQGGFCCLGVLCNLHAQANPELAASQKDPYSYFNANTVLPRQVVDWAGLASNSGRIEKDAASLWELNDVECRDFKFIANVIEQNVAKL